MVRAAVAGVHAEIAYAHELEARRGLCRAAFTLGVVLLCLFDERGFDLAAGQDRQGVRVQAVEEVLVRAVGLGVGEEVLIQAHLGVDRCFAVDPVDRRALDLAAVGGVAAAGIGVIRRVNFLDAAVGGLLAAGAGDEIRTLQTALRAVGVQTLILGDGFGEEIVRLDPDLAGERDGVRALFGMDGVVFNLKGFRLALGIVRDDELHRAQNGHGALCRVVEIFAQAVLQKRVFHSVGRLRHADALAEIADGMAGVASSSQTAERRHTRIVPAGDIILLDQLAQLALGHDGVVDAETGKLDLPGLGGNGDVVYHPVVQRAVRLEFQRAQRVRDALQRVLNGVGKVIHRIDAPLVALPVMVHIADAVNDRVAHIEVAGGKIDFCAQRAAALGELAVFHALEQVEVFLDGAVAVRAYGGLADIAAELAELLGRQVADVGKALLDQFDGKLVVLFKVI